MNIKLYILHLDERFRSKSLISENNNGLKIEYELVAGFDYRSVSLSELEDLDIVKNTFSISRFEKRHRRKPLPSEIGCLLSHRKIYCNFASSSFDFAVVAEDDYELLGHDWEKITSLIDYLKNHKDPVIVTFYSRSCLVGSKIPDAPFDSYELINVPYSTCCYLINRSAAEVMCSSNLMIDTVADWPNSALKVRFLFANIGRLSEGSDNSHIQRKIYLKANSRYKLYSSLTSKISSIFYPIRFFVSLRNDGLPLAYCLKVVLANYISYRFDRRRIVHEDDMHLFESRLLFKFLSRKYLSR
jgi:GR25 family glycosyltransferase involved in LPS biosynthesis